MRTIILLCCFLLGSGITSLQAQDFTPLAPCWVHFDRPFYVTAEEIGYQLYLPTEFRDHPVVINAILMDALGQEVAHRFLTTEGQATVAGAYLIPADLPTGWYYFSYRVWDRSRATERVLLQAPLAIYNDQEVIAPERVSQREPASQSGPVAPSERPLQIEISLRPMPDGADQQARLSIQVTNHRGRPVAASLSVSIIDWQLLSPSLAMGMDNLQGGDSLKVVVVDRLSQELFWQGVLLDGNQQPLPRTALELRSPHSGATTLYTDERGLFPILQPVFEGDRRFFWRDEQGAPAQAVVLPATGRLEFGELYYSPGVIRYLQLSRQRKQMARLTGWTDGPIWSSPDLTPAREAVLTGLNPADEVPAGLPGAFRTRLYWQAGLQTNSDGRLFLPFRQSDEQSTFRVEVVAQDADGHRGRASITYRVE
ncbi:MAG: hypothetical protein KDC54_09050 [Lewinella sp.]|nr:hypothetical protein [Lewinella sp.]